MVRAEFNEAVFGSCRIELKKHSGSVKDGDTTDCTGRGGRIFAIRSGCAIVDPVIKDLAKLMLSFSGFVSRGFAFFEWAILN
jgi:hypothetical protein